MGNKQMLSVDRELLVTLCNLHAVGFEDIAPEIKELRALLDKPACAICKMLGDICVTCEAAKPKPDAWQIRSMTDRHGSQWSPWRECSGMERAMHMHEVGRFNQHGIKREIRGLYAEKGEQ